MSRIAVVILNYNGKELLEQFLPGVIRHSSEAKIIVADNNSNDDSVSFVKSNHQNVEVISIPNNLGFCGGYNFALKQVPAEFYVLLNSDVEVTEGWLIPLLASFDDKKVGAVQPKILSYREKQKFEYAGAAGGFIDILGYPFCRGRIFNEVEEDHHQYDETKSVFWATGACLMIRSQLFHSLGAFDETFFAHMEEIDLCWRLNRSGHKVQCIPRSHVYHVGGATLDKSNPRKTYYNFRNGLMLVIKNWTPLQMLVRLPIRILLDWIAGMKFLLEGHPKDFIAVWRAHFYVLFNFLSTTNRRSSTLLYKVYNVYQNSIVFDYYVRMKKKFSDLNF
ncbi:MAG: glycosyltransferase family 2 protein [Cyclobacteriaceae bacterium]|nr:glycosyltransferase family 2 protein [Cyclobacteriaceae bacterium]